MKKIIALILLSVFTTSFMGSACYAGWVDDWLQQKTVSSPDYLEGQKRGYFTGGSFDARWNTGQNDYLFSVSPPKFAAGCGGIDAFMGGFSFMNMNYLVKKLQSIMTSAPAFALDIAIQNYCPQCSTTMNALESVADKLNGLQFNDCAASKAIAAQIVGPYTKNPGQYAHALSNYASSQGWTSLWQDMKQATSSNNDNAAQPNSSSTPNLRGMNSGCPQEMVDLFLTPGSLLDHLQSEFGGVSTDYIQLLRGFVGDIEITQDPDGKPDLVPVPPCHENDKRSVDEFIAGTTAAEPDPSLSGQPAACVQLQDVNANLEQWAINIMSGISTQMLNGGPLSAPQEAFLTQIPFSAKLILKYAVASGQVSSITAEFAAVAAKGYAFAMMEDLDHNANAILENAMTVSASNTGATQESPAADCNVSALYPTKALEKYQLKIIAMQDALQMEYAKWAASLSSMQTLAARMQQFDEQSYKMLSSAFHSSLASRATGK